MVSHALRHDLIPWTKKFEYVQTKIKYNRAMQETRWHYRYIDENEIALERHRWRKSLQELRERLKDSAIFDEALAAA